MRVAIAGAGMTGAYLYRLLKNAGCEVHLYDRKKGTRCGLTPCGWGTSADFSRLVGRAGLDPEKYVMKRLDTLTIDSLRVRAKLLTFDKPALIGDLLADAAVTHAPLNPQRYQMIVDATGAQRALLPPIAGDVILDCCEYLVETEAPLENRVSLIGSGYAWCFPLSGGRYHVGCGTLLDDPRELLRRMGWGDGETGRKGIRTICGCTGRIRLTGAHLSQPFVIPGSPSVWGIGEAIGCVAPLVGDGIVPGMRSVELLLENWESPAAYREALLAEFQWMQEEREVFDTLTRGEGVGVREARVLLRNSRRMNIEIGVEELMGILKVLAVNYLARACPGYGAGKM